MPQMKSFFDLVNELSMKSDKKLPNLKMPVKGKKGVSKFTRKKAIGQAKDDLNAGFKSDANRKAAFAKMNDAVQSADRKPEKYLKPDGKIGIRMVKTDKEVIKKEASVLKPTKPTDIIKHAKTLAKNPRDYMMNKKKYLDKARAKVFRMYPREEVEETNEMIDPMDLRGRPKKKDPNPESPYGMKHPLHPANIAKKKAKEAEKVKKEAKTFNYFDSNDDAQAHAKKHGGKVYVNTGKGNTKVKGKRINTHVVIKKEEVDVKEDVTHMTIHNGADGFNSAKKASHKKDYEKKHGVKVSFSGNGVTYSGKKANVTKAARGHFPDHKEDGMPSDIHKWHDGKDISVKKEEVQVDEALNLAQRMKRSRLMKRMKARIKIGRKRAMKKMANKKTIEKRAMRQARNQLAKKLTRGIPKKELTFARKQEIEKRLAKPALQQRIKRIAKRIFKDVRKAEVQRKKG